jgi:predicted nucleic acid-binding protein
LKILLDASTLIPLVTQSGKNLITQATNQNLLTTDLAVYESCNGIWKLATLIKTLTYKEAQDTINTLHNVISQKIIQTVNFSAIDLAKTFDIAQKTQTTFYDATYIAVAENIQAVLATEDKKLFKEASKTVKAITFVQLQNELNLK